MITERPAAAGAKIDGLEAEANLAAAEERALAARVAAGRDAPPGPARDDALAARDRLVLMNRRLAVKAARAFLHRGVEFLDLVQEGTRGLIHAAWTYDPARGTRFTTYATSWIRSAIGRAVLEHGRTIRTPENVYADAETLRVGGPSVAGWTAMRRELAARLEPTRVQARIQDLDEETIPGRVEDHGREIEEAEELAGLERLLAGLQDREARVIRLRFGLVDGRERTNEEVGRELGTCEEMARKVGLRALGKLRAAARYDALRSLAGGAA